MPAQLSRQQPLSVGHQAHPANESRWPRLAAVSHQIETVCAVRAASFEKPHSFESTGTQARQRRRVSTQVQEHVLRPPIKQAPAPCLRVHTPSPAQTIATATPASNLTAASQAYML